MYVTRVNKKKVTFCFVIQDCVYKSEISAREIPGIYKGCFKKILLPVMISRFPNIIGKFQNIHVCY